MDAFVKATKNKFRWDSPVGQLSVEDLWDLPLTSTKKNVANLDDIAIGLNQQLQQQNTQSFVKKTNTSNAELQTKFEIVLYVIEAKQIEQTRSEERAAKAEQKKALLSILAQKQNEELMSKSSEEIKALIENL